MISLVDLLLKHTVAHSCAFFLLSPVPPRCRWRAELPQSHDFEACRRSRYPTAK